MTVVKSLCEPARTIALGASATPVLASGMFERPFGALGDVGAPDLFYVSIDRSGQRTAADLPTIAAGMAASKGVILDLRGYPDPVGYEILAQVLPRHSVGSRMEFVETTAGRRTLEPIEDVPLSSWTAEPQRYAGPLIVLTGPGTQSSAEFCVDFVRSTRRARIVGGATSGANGNITRVRLPGGATFSFTGMRVTHRDGSPFHARGHVPDVVVEQSAADLREGRDTVLLRAIAELRDR